MAAGIIHVAGLAVATIVLFSLNRHQWFFGDEWDFIANRGLGHSVRGVFQPHNEHWVTIPILIYRALIASVGLHSYTPYVAVVILTHIAVAAVMWKVLLRCGSHPVIATALVAAFSLLGAGSENLLWAFQITLVGSALVGALLLLLVNHSGPRSHRDVIAVGIATVGLMFSGMTISMIVAAAVCVALRRGFRHAALFAAVPSVVYLAWFTLVGHQGVNHDTRSIDTIYVLPRYIWRGFTAGLDVATDISGIGVVVALLLAWWLIRNDGFRGTNGAVASAGFVGVMMMFLLAGITRASSGVDEAAASRYIYVEFMLLLPAASLALTEVTENRDGRVAVVTSVLVFLLVSNIGQLRTAAKVEAAREQPIRREILAAAELVHSEAPVYDVQVEPTFSPDLSMSGLRSLVQHANLPQVHASRGDQLAAARQVQIGLDQPLPGPARTVAPVAVLAVGDATRLQSAGDCSAFKPAGPHPALIIDVPVMAALRVTVEVAAKVSISLRDRAQPTTAAPARVLQLQAGPHQIGILAADTSPVIELPASGTTIVCGLTAVPPGKSG